MGFLSHTLKLTMHETMPLTLLSSLAANLVFHSMMAVPPPVLVASHVSGVRRDSSSDR